MDRKAFLIKVQLNFSHVNTRTHSQQKRHRATQSKWSIRLWWLGGLVGMLTTLVLGWEADMLAGRLAVHLPSASEGIAASAIELEMSGKCDKGI